MKDDVQFIGQLWYPTFDSLNFDDGARNSLIRNNTNLENLITIVF